MTDRPRRLPLVALLSMVLAASACAPAPGETQPSTPAIVLLDSDGRPFARRGDYREAPLDVARLPKHVVNAVLAIEDRRFYRHGGIDLEGVGRAALANARAGKVVQGGSTITQQLAKLTAAGTEQTFERKLHEATVALWLEARFTKDEILSRYLNAVYLGDGVYGLAAASRHYFNKEAGALTLSEAALLAGVINKPSRLAPTKNLEGAHVRGRLVLSAMVDAGFITPGEAAAAKPAALRLGRKIASTGGWYADWIAPDLRKRLEPGYGEVFVSTALDRALQVHAEQVVGRALTGAGARQGASQAALVAMHPDGRVVAMVGGQDRLSGSFNRAVQARRQPGSTFKLFVYIAALREGADPWSMVEDSPVQLGDWTPRNADGLHRGWISLEQAFATSNNVAAVKLSEAVGRGDVIRAARDFGLTGDLAATPSLALGASETSLLELTAAYAAIAAGEYPVLPTAAPERPWSPKTAIDIDRVQRPMLDLLHAAAQQGTGRRAALPLPVFAKTGTSQNNRDAWFIGFAGDLVVGVWVGNDDGSPMKNVSGGGLPADIWKDFMQVALKEQINAAIASRAAEERIMRLSPPALKELLPPRSQRWSDLLLDFLGVDQF